MKKSKLILVMGLLLICSTACSNSQQPSTSATSANQDEFLNPWQQVSVLVLPMTQTLQI